MINSFFADLLSANILLEENHLKDGNLGFLHSNNLLKTSAEI